MARTFVIGDIHGHLTPFDAILQSINLQPDDTLITLGDYIDRGPDSKPVIERMIELQSRCKQIPLLGNHEEMMLAVKVRGPARGGLYEWLLNGGDSTLESYTGKSLPTLTLGNAAAMLANIPEAHWQFLSTTCRGYYETETHLFVHAGADPKLPLDQQTSHTLRWERFFDPLPHVSGKILVCGHTPQKSGFPRFIGHALCIDTGIHVSRVLTCLEIETGAIIQADATGVLRTSKLEDHRVPTPQT